MRTENVRAVCWLAGTLRTVVLASDRCYDDDNMMAHKALDATPTTHSVGCMRQRSQGQAEHSVLPTP